MGRVSIKNTTTVLLSGKSANFARDFILPIKCYSTQTLSVYYYYEKLLAIQFWGDSECIDLRFKI